jgi:hypothetical protein
VQDFLKITNERVFGAIVPLNFVQGD